MGTITFQKHNVSFPLKETPLIKSFLTSIFAREGTDFKAVSFIFCTDEFLLKLNQQYLNHDTLTDILTFTLSETSMPIVSEIYISVERVKENSQNLNISFSMELCRVMIHGVLHLCGYNDRTKSEKRTMRAKEDFYLSGI